MQNKELNIGKIFFEKDFTQRRKGAKIAEKKNKVNFIVRKLRFDVSGNDKEQQFLYFLCVLRVSASLRDEFGEEF
jgi:hypothetical protein